MSPCYVRQFPFCEHVTFMKIEKMIPQTYSFPLNLLQCAYFINTKVNEWFCLLENNIILVFECFPNLNQCIFNKNTLKWRIWTTPNVSWVISNMVATRPRWPHKHKTLTCFAISLKENEIITLIYKIKTCRLIYYTFVYPRI